jgi:hypothetical protein
VNNHRRRAGEHAVPLLGMQLAQGVAVEQRGLTTLAVVLRLLISPLLATGWHGCWA